MRARNLCMHRDFQNVGVNGARIDGLDLVASLQRNSTSDKPLTTFLALIGNDVRAHAALACAAGSFVLRRVARRVRSPSPPAHPYTRTPHHPLLHLKVCNGHAGSSHMTTPSEFNTSLLSMLDALDAKLPPKSHVAIVGLVDGRILWDTMHGEWTFNVPLHSFSANPQLIIS